MHSGTHAPAGPCLRKRKSAERSGCLRAAAGRARSTASVTRGLSAAGRWRGSGGNPLPSVRSVLARQSDSNVPERQDGRRGLSARRAAGRREESGSTVMRLGGSAGGVARSAQACRCRRGCQRSAVHIGLGEGQRPIRAGPQATSSALDIRRQASTPESDSLRWECNTAFPALDLRKRPSSPTARRNRERGTGSDAVPRKPPAVVFLSLCSAAETSPPSPPAISP